MILLITKKIHYIWFGPSDLSDLNIKCIESWERELPDFEIIRHDESNYNIRQSCDFFKKSYEIGKFALCSDVARMEILQEEGGIYFDTDVYLYRRPDEEILNSDCFVGLESKRKVGNSLLMNGLIGCNDLIKSQLDQFYNFDFSGFETMIKRWSSISINLLNSDLRSVGLKTPNKSFISSVIYKSTPVTYASRDYFYPIYWSERNEPFFSDNTVGIHLWDLSWISGLTHDQCREVVNSQILEIPSRFLVDGLISR